jgi:two-component system sensor histidine kinase BarA
MKGLGIKKRLLFLAVLPGTIIALVLFIYFTRGQLDLVEQSLNERGLTIARQLAPASEYGYITGNRVLLEQLATALLKQSDIAGVSIFDTENRPHFVMGSLDSIRKLPIPGAKEAMLCGGSRNQLLFCAPILKTELQISDFPGSEVLDPPQRVIGWVYVEMSTRSMQQQQRAIIARALLITGLLLLLTGVVAVRVGRQISLPIVEMTHAVGKVAAGNLDLRIKAGSAGEIGQLQKGIDSMIASLRVARDEMRSNIDDATVQLRQALGELEERNRDLEDQRKRAQAASEAKSRFLANMSHEIRTPLSGMVGILFMLRQTRPSPEQKEYLENLENSAATLRALIDDILDLSRIEAGRLTIHEQEFVLRDLLAAVTAMLVPEAHHKGIEFIVHVQRDVPRWLMGDPLRLRQILTNLLGNAVKFTEHGYVRLLVSCELERESHILRTRFMVEDSGIGIAREKLDYIFESFAQADETTTRRYGGSGLGTTISRELVALMGGTLQVESEERRGTRFIFDLPLGYIDNEELEPPPYAGSKALLLESHPLGRVAEQEALEMLGFEVTAIDSAEQLLTALDEGDKGYRLLVLAENDCRSSKIGLAGEIRRRLKGSARLLHLTFFEGAHDPTIYDGVLHKPLDINHLKTKLDELLDGIPSQTPEPVAMTASSGVLSILVAEDDPINAKVMTFFLQQKGHQVVLATNGREALEQLRHRLFDVGFLDMRMPEMDGLMVSREWRREEGAGRHLPLIAVTANVTREDRAACFEAGMDDFVSKPIDPVRLSELLDRYVQIKVVPS